MWSQSFPQSAAVTNCSGEGEVTRWANRHGLRYYRANEPSLGGWCLKVHLGHVTAYFREGKLARMWVHADGEFLDEVFYQLSQLFELCAQVGGYPDQQVIAALAERCSPVGQAIAKTPVADSNQDI